MRHQPVDIHRNSEDCLRKALSTVVAPSDDKQGRWGRTCRSWCSAVEGVMHRWRSDSGDKDGEHSGLNRIVRPAISSRTSIKIQVSEDFGGK